MSIYKPATLSDAEVMARGQRAAKRRTEEAGIPGKTQTYQTTDKLDDSLIYEAGDNIDITDGVISAPEMTRGEIDAICTFD